MILKCIIAIGVLLRTLLYLSNQSLWWDETALAYNIIEKSYLELFFGLDNLQAAPPLFLVLSKFLTNFFHNTSIYNKDLLLRLIPYISSIGTIFAFNYFIKLVTDNRKIIVFSTAFIALNPCAIMYSAQFKQYSTELFFSVILLIIFYKLIFQNNINKVLATIFILISPWFSYSSLFVISSGFITLFIKNKKNSLFLIFPFLLNLIIYYLVSLKHVFSTNYSGMDTHWSNGYAFMSIFHPQRLILRLGELIIDTSNISLPKILAGMILITIIIQAIFYFKDKLKHLFYMLPIYMVLIASFMHYYPIKGRLILFLIPYFAIFFAIAKGRFNQILQIILIIIVAYSIIGYKFYNHEIAYSYARDAIKYIKKQSNDITIIIDSPSTDYDFYIKQEKIQNRIIYLNEHCNQKQISTCQNRLKNINNGHYYFLSSSNYVNDIVKPLGYEIKDLDINHWENNTKAIYFIK